jgi:hypothetical protein
MELSNLSRSSQEDVMLLDRAALGFSSVLQIQVIECFAVLQRL